MLPTNETSDSNKYLLCLKEEGSNSDDVYGLFSPNEVK